MDMGEVFKCPGRDLHVGVLKMDDVEASRVGEELWLNQGNARHGEEVQLNGENERGGERRLTWVMEAKACRDRAKSEPEMDSSRILEACLKRHSNNG